MALLDDVRRACAEVAARAAHVEVDAGAVASYAAALPAAGAPSEPVLLHGGLTLEERAGRALTLDAVNFGSGWFPTLRKREGLSGYRTVAAGLEERFAGRGAWRPEELVALEAEELAAVLGQDPGHELVGLWVAHLRALGRHVLEKGEGRFAGVVADSAEAQVERLARWPSFADCSIHAGRRVPLLKRAQIAALDLHRAGAARFADLHRLTLFADNLVPHVLRVDGVLRVQPGLVGRIERGELIEHGSPEEVELRAVALHAVEMLSAARADLSAAEIDLVLWERGGEPRYKAVPRHRARCTAY